MKKRKAGKRISIFLLILFIAAIVYLYVQLYMIPDITGALTSTQIVSYGQIETSNDARCMIVREETVTFADQSGTVSYYAEEGEKTRINSKVLDVYPAGGTACPYYCKLTGFISYEIDGLEGSYTAETAGEALPSFILENESSVSDVTKKTCEKDDPLFKTVTSNEWIALIAADISNKDRYTAGEKITIRFLSSESKNSEEETEDRSGIFSKHSEDESSEEASAEYTAEVPATITGVFEKEGMLLITATSSRYFENFAAVRFADINVVTSSKDGLLIAASAVTEEEGVTGVYKKEISGEYVFVPVQILAQDGENCVVTPDSFTKEEADGTKTTVATLRIYDEILKNGQDGAVRQ